MIMVNCNLEQSKLASCLTTDHPLSDFLLSQLDQGGADAKRYVGHGSCHAQDERAYY
jgi:hypothetical protein